MKKRVKIGDVVVVGNNAYIVAPDHHEYRNGDNITLTKAEFMVSDEGGTIFREVDFEENDGYET